MYQPKSISAKDKKVYCQDLIRAIFIIFSLKKRLCIIDKKLNPRSRPRLKVINIEYGFGSHDNKLILEDIIERNAFELSENSTSIVRKYSSNNKYFRL